MFLFFLGLYIVSFLFRTVRVSDRGGLRVRICQGAVLKFCSRQPFPYVSIKGPGCNHIPIQNLFHGRYLQKPS